MPHRPPNCTPTKQNPAQVTSLAIYPHKYFFQSLCFLGSTTGVGVKGEDDTKVVSQLSPKERISVLIVDDDDHFRRALIGSLLELTDFEVHTEEADSGESTLEKLSGGRHNFDWIFLDIKLPGMDGIETYKRIKSINSEIRIILMTSDLNVALRVESAIGKKVYDKRKLYLKLASILCSNTGEHDS